MSAALFLPSQASADDISLNLKNVTVKRAIAALQQSHYSLTVDASQIDMERRITVAAEDEPIENVLAQIFAGQDVSYEINGRSIVVTRRAVPRVAESSARQRKSRNNLFIKRIVFRYCIYKRRESRFTALPQKITVKFKPHGLSRAALSLKTRS